MTPARGALVVASLWMLVACSTPSPAPESVPPSALTTTPSALSATPSASPSRSASTSAPTTTPTGCTWAPCYTAPTDDGSLPAAVQEASGIAASGVDADLFFVVDDASGTDTILAVRGDGSPVTTIDVGGVTAANAEALSAGVCSAGSPERCLFVGDIGGNSGRGEITVHRLPEPVGPSAGSGPSVTADAWTYAYPDGSYDAEAMLVGDDGGIIVITKPDRGRLPHRVYVGAPGGGDLVLHSIFRPPGPVSPTRSLLVGNVVTDATRTADTVLLLTYDQAVEYHAPTPDADPADFALWPWRQVPIPDQWQSEGITYRTASCGYVVVSEKSPFGSATIGGVGCA